MTVTVTDLFCGAGGSSLGAEQAGAQLVMAANHWQTAIDVHQAHFPHAGHDCADLSQVDPRRYVRTNVLIASPECTNHSQARGVSRRAQQPGLWDAPDPTAERSRATMFDVIRFAEQMRYDAIVVENVVEVTKWLPYAPPAELIIDWSLPCVRIGDRTKALAPATRARILAGLQRYGWAPITTSGAGNVHERTPLDAHEVAAAMAFPDGYLPTSLPKTDRVKLAGNAVCPPNFSKRRGELVDAGLVTCTGEGLSPYGRKAMLWTRTAEGEMTLAAVMKGADRG